LKQHYNTLLVTNIISSIHTLELEKELKIIECNLFDEELQLRKMIMFELMLILKN